MLPETNYAALTECKLKQTDWSSPCKYLQFEECNNYCAWNEINGKIIFNYMNTSHIFKYMDNGWLGFAWGFKVW